MCAYIFEKKIHPAGPCALLLGHVRIFFLWKNPTCALSVIKNNTFDNEILKPIFSKLFYVRAPLHLLDPVRLIFFDRELAQAVLEIAFFS